MKKKSQAALYFQSSNLLLKLLIGLKWRLLFREHIPKITIPRKNTINFRVGGLGQLASLGYGGGGVKVEGVGAVTDNMLNIWEDLP